MENSNINLQTVHCFDQTKRFKMTLYKKRTINKEQNEFTAKIMRCPKLQQNNLKACPMMKNGTAETP